MPASERLWQIGGVVVGVALAIATAIWEAVLTPMFVVSGGHVIRLPVAPLIAIVANVAIVWFTLTVTRNIPLALVPGLAWVIVMFAAGDLTSDGDLIVEGTWVGLTTILLGAGAWAVGAIIWTSRSGRRAWEAPPTVPSAPTASLDTTAGAATTKSGTRAAGPQRSPGPARKRPKKSRSR